MISGAVGWNILRQTFYQETSGSEQEKMWKAILS
jgi:hypothetical protein